MLIIVNHLSVFSPSFVLVMCVLLLLCLHRLSTHAHVYVWQCIYICERESAAPPFIPYQLRLSVILRLLGNHLSALCSVPEVKRR